MSRADEAGRLFREGHACSQAVLCAFAPSLGLDPDVALRMAAPFAAGMSAGEACGAATGAYMVLGLALCDESCAQLENRGPIAEAVDTFNQRFRSRIWALDCPDIIGCDLSSDAGKAAAAAQALFVSRCLPAVRASADILDEMLAEVLEAE